MDFIYMLSPVLSQFAWEERIGWALRWGLAGSATLISVWHRCVYYIWRLSYFCYDHITHIYFNTIHTLFTFVLTGCLCWCHSGVLPAAPLHQTEIGLLYWEHNGRLSFADLANSMHALPFSLFYSLKLLTTVLIFSLCHVGAIWPKFSLL